MATALNRIHGKAITAADTFTRGELRCRVFARCGAEDDESRSERSFLDTVDRGGKASAGTARQRELKTQQAQKNSAESGRVGMDDLPWSQFDST